MLHFYGISYQVNGKFSFNFMEISFQVGVGVYERDFMSMSIKKGLFKKNLMWKIWAKNKKKKE